MQKNSVKVAVAGILVLTGFFNYALAWEVLEGEHDPRYVPLDASGLGFNNDGVASKKDPKGNLAGGYAFPAEAFPPLDSKIAVNGVPFLLKSKKFTIPQGERKGEVILANNRSGYAEVRIDYGKHNRHGIRAPNGYYSALYILGCSEEDVWVEPKLNILYGSRDFVQAKLSRWDAKVTKAADEFPAIQVKKMLKNGKLVKKPGTVWMKKVKLNPNVFGGSGGRYNLIVFPEIPMIFGTHVFAMTLEKAPMYLEVKGTKHYHYENEPFELEVTVFNTTDKPKEAILDCKWTHFFGSTVGQPMTVKVPAAKGAAKGSAAVPGSVTKKIPFNFKLRGHYWQDIVLSDPSGEELARTHNRMFVTRTDYGIQSSLHIQSSSGRIGSPKNPLVKLFGALETDRNVDSKYIQLTLGRCNGEAELTQHDPARYAQVIKEQYLLGQERIPGGRAMIYGASGYSEEWWLRFIENGGYDYIDAMWVEPVIVPRAPESVSGFWKVASSDDWMWLYKKFGHREVEARLNVQGRPHGEPGLGISWADQGVSDWVLGKYIGRAIIMLAREAEHISLTDSWGRQYNSRWWDAWGMGDAAGPFARIAASIHCFAMLDRSKYVGQLSEGFNEDIYCYLFEGENGPLMALWTTKVIPEDISLNVGKSQVKITDLMDSSRTVKCKKKTLNLELTDSPIFVEGFSKSLFKRVRKEEKVEPVKPVKKTLAEKQVFIAMEVAQDTRMHRWQRVINIDAGQEIPPDFFFVSIYNFTNKAVRGEVEILAPEGWKITPQKIKLGIGPREPDKLNPKGQPIRGTGRFKEMFPFRVHVPIDAKAGVYRLHAKSNFRGRPVEKVSLDNIQIHSPIKIHSGLRDVITHQPKVKVTIKNPLEADLAKSSVRLLAPEGFTVQPPSIKLKALKPGEEQTVEFKVGTKTPKPFNRYEVTVEAVLAGRKVSVTDTLDFFTIVPAEKEVRIDGSLDEWSEAYPFHLKYSDLDGGAPLGERWMQDNYIYHWRKKSFQAKAYMMHDESYFYVAIDVNDDWVTNELAAMYSYTGILDHSDEQMIVIDSDSSGAVNLREDGIAERTFVFFPRGPREAPYTGKFSDPFPVFKECTHWLGLHGAPQPGGSYQYPLGGTFPAGKIGFAVKVYDEDTPEHPKGYVMEIAYPMKLIGMDPGTDPTIQLWTLDADRKMLYFYNWFAEPTVVKDAAGKVVRNNWYRGMKMKFIRGKGKKSEKKMFGDTVLRNILDGDLSWNRLQLDKNPGDFVKFKLANKPKSCGLVAALGKEIAAWHDPRSFEDPARVDAETVFFSGSGTLEYKFDKIKLPRKAKVNRAIFLTEICSEYPEWEGFCYTWPSEITLWVNDKEVGTFLAPGDVVSGWLVAWDIREDGCYINNTRCSDLNLEKLGIGGRSVKMTIGVKEDAKYRNGMNLYGDKNGKHGRDVTLLLYY